MSLVVSAQSAPQLQNPASFPLALNTSLNGPGSVFLDANLVFSGGVDNFEAALSVAVADFNGDGKLDIAVAALDGSGHGSAVTVLLGNGDGTFQAAKNVISTLTPAYVAAGDLNGDGKADLVVLSNLAPATPSVNVLLGNGDGTFTQKSSITGYSNPQSLVLVDLNGDGKLDIAVVDAGTNSVLVSLGNGDGTFQSAVTTSGFGTGFAKYVAAGDFNKDGHLDLVISDQNSGHVVVLLGNGNGTFQAARNFAFPAGQVGNGFDVAVGDFNGDGIPDIAATNRDAGAVNIFLGMGNGNFQPAVAYTAALPNFGPTNLVVADFNKDGKLDIMAAQGQGSTVSVLFGKGDGTFSAPLFLASNNNPSQLAVGDFNGDGNLDWVAGSTTQMYLTVCLGNGNGTFQDAVDYSLGQGPDAILGDFNNDGKSDIVSVNFNSGNVSVLLGNGDRTFQPAMTTAISGAYYGIATGDFNADGNLDVVIGDSTGLPPRNVIVLLGKGDGTFAAPVRYTTSGSGEGQIVIADFNGDGKLDIAVVNQSDNTISLLLGNGDGTFQAGKVATAALATDGFLGNLIAADFNRDGKMDLATVDYCGLNCGNLSILLGNGNGTFQSPTVLSTVAGATGLTAADFNKDGKLDLAAAGQLGGVDVYLGNGDGTFNTPISLNTKTCPTGSSCPSGGLVPQFYVVSAADFNLDGNVDLVVGGGAQDQGCPGCFFSNVNIGFELFLGKGDGTFTGPQDYMAGAASNNMAVGDLNGDGAPDLLVTDTGENLVSVMINQTPPPLNVSPNSLSFGNQLVGTSSPTKPITLKNNGGSTATITISVSGDFTQTNNCASLTAGSSCTINVAFKPSTTGARAGNLVVSDNLPGGPQKVALTGTGVAPAVTLSAASIPFGNQGVGTTSAPPQMVGLSNTGTASLTITSITITGANSGDFAQTNTCGGSVAAGANCSINVTFTPLATGARAASVSITDNAAGSPQAISLTGTGVAPAVSLSPTSLNFAGQLVTTSSPAKNISVMNGGTATLAITSITITGANSGDFSQTNTCGASLAAGANCSIAVTFTPTATGNRAANVMITDSATGSPQAVSLSGTGTDFSVDVASGGANTATVKAGQPASYSLQVTPISGFSGTVSLTCTGAPSESTCTVPNSSTPNGAAAPFSANVTTTAPSLMTPRGLPPNLPPLLLLRIGTPLLIVLLALQLCARFGKATAQRRFQFAYGLALATFLVIATYLSGCGGGGGGGVHDPGTPAGSYTLTVTGTSGNVNHSVKLTLNVN